MVTNAALSKLCNKVNPNHLLSMWNLCIILSKKHVLNITNIFYY